MTLLMLSLAGIPPTVGFYAKLSILQAMIATQEPLYLQLAVAAVVLSWWAPTTTCASSS